MKNLIFSLGLACTFGLGSFALPAHAGMSEEQIQEAEEACEEGGKDSVLLYEGRAVVGVRCVSRERTPPPLN